MAKQKGLLLHYNHKMPVYFSHLLTQKMYAILYGYPKSALWMEERMTENYFANLDRADIFELILDKIGGVTLVGRDGRWIYVNNAFTELTGYSRKDLHGQYVRAIFPDSFMYKVLSTGESISNVPFQLKTKGGEVIQLVGSYYPIWDDGVLRGCIFVTFLRNMEQVMELSSNINELLDKLTLYRKSLTEIQGAKYSIDNIIGKSPQIKAMKRTILQAARSASTVLIEGETGSGKELVASSIHHHSRRSTNAFIKVNCAAIPKELLESEFFGYEAGAFTGASKSGKKGKFELANEGTLFLDEINQLPFELQPKLLRAIQEREIERVGGTRSIPIDCRLIAASNVPLQQLVEEGQFRKDLYYRLNVVNIRVPPLRERKEDIPILADSLLERLNEQLGMRVPGISCNAKEHLKQYDWPGNVRELQNVIERAMNIAWSETITWQHLKPSFITSVSTVEPETIHQMPIRKRKYDLELETIKSALELTGGNKSRAAEVLQISRGMLYKKLKKYGL